MGIDSLYFIHHPSFTKGKELRRGAGQLWVALRKQSTNELTLPHSTVRALAKDPALPEALDPFSPGRDLWLTLWGESRWLSPAADLSQ